MRATLALGMLALLVAGSLSYARAASNERGRLIADMRSFGIESIAIADTITPIDEAPTHALRIAWFAEIARIDPLFAVPGTDPQALRDAAAELNVTKSRIATGYPEDESAIIQRALFPDRLLTALPKLESARRLLISAPSMEHARAYHRELLATVDAYEAGVLALDQAVKRFVPRETQYAFPGGTTNAAAFERALAHLHTQAGESHAHARKRYACVFRFSSSCETLDSMNRARLATVPASESIAATLERDFSPTLKNLHSAFSAFAGTGTTVTYESSCYRDNPLPVSVWYLRSATGMAKKLSRIDDIYFFGFTAASEYDPDQVRAQGGAPNLGKRMYDEGARALYQISGNTYLCADAAHDFAVVARVIGLQRALKDKMIFSTSDKDIDTRTLARQEARIRTATALTEHETNTWIREVATRLTDRHALIETIGEEKVRYLEAVVATYVRGSSAYDETLRSVTVESSYLLLMEAAGERMPLASLLLSRSAPSIFFLAANTSVTKDPVSFLASTNPQSLSRFGISMYSEERARPLASLTRDLMNAVKIQERLYEELPAE